MKRMLLKTKQLEDMVKKHILSECSFNLLYGEKPIIKLFIDEDGAHIRMINVKGDHDTY